MVIPETFDFYPSIASLRKFFSHAEKTLDKEIKGESA